MARLTQRIEIARRALESLDELADHAVSKVLVDGFGVQANSPKPVMRAWLEALAQS